MNADPKTLEIPLGTEIHTLTVIAEIVTALGMGKLAGDVEIEGAWLEWLGEQVMAQVAGLENYQAIAMGRRKG